MRFVRHSRIGYRFRGRAKRYFPARRRFGGVEKRAAVRGIVFAGKERPCGAISNRAVPVRAVRASAGRTLLGRIVVEDRCGRGMPYGEMCRGVDGGTVCRFGWARERAGTGGTRNWERGDRSRQGAGGGFAGAIPCVLLRRWLDGVGKNRGAESRVRGVKTEKRKKRTTGAGAVRTRDYGFADGRYEVFRCGADPVASEKTGLQRVVFAGKSGEAERSKTRKLGCQGVRQRFRR